jgi:hypothetical protein
MAVFAAAIICAGCGGIIPPLDSPLPTATRSVASSTPAPAPLATPVGSPTVTPTDTTTPTPGPSPTPDMQETSAAVIATITAMAATPTYPPTSTPRPVPTPIGAGPKSGDIPPTAALYSSGGITVQMISQQGFPGGSATLTIRVKPAAVCILEIDRSTGGQTRIEPIPGNATHTAGRDGVVAWIWTIDTREPAGIMHLIVDCGQAGKAKLQMQITQ